MEETKIFETPRLEELMKWTNKRLLLELKKRARVIAEQHGLSAKATEDLVKKSFRDIQAIRYRIH